MPEKVAEPDTAPAATWGSVADEPTPRPIRGRKFYWRTDTDYRDPLHRGARRKHHADALTRRVRLIPPGTRFTTRVAFENLSAAQVGSLLAALCPRLLFDDPAAERPDGRSRIVTSVGGGKPFGFGAVDVAVRVDRLDTALSRYLGRPAPTPTIEDLLAAFREEAPRAARAHWEAVRTVLTLDAVDDQLVWYPPGTGVRGSEEFDQGFDFWRNSAGLEMKRTTRRLVTLPWPTDPDQVLDSGLAEVPKPSSDPPPHRADRRPAGPQGRPQGKQGKRGKGSGRR